MVEEIRRHLLISFGVLLVEAVLATVAFRCFHDSQIIQIAREHHMGAVAIGFLAVLFAPYLVKTLVYLWGEPEGAVAKYCGIEQYLPHTDDTAVQEWSDWAAKIRAEKRGRLRILTFTGDTLTQGNRPLLNVLKKHCGDLQLLVALPSKLGFRDKLALLETHESPENLENILLEQHNHTKLVCRVLVDEMRSGPLRTIEVRGYELPVIWKMILFRDYLWLQHYIYKGEVDKTPVYILREGINSSLFTPFEAMFDTYWNSAVTLLKREAGRPKEDCWDQQLVRAREERDSERDIQSAVDE